MSLNTYSHNPSISHFYPQYPVMRLFSGPMCPMCWYMVFFEDGVDCIQYPIVGLFNAKCCDTYMHVGLCLFCHWKGHYLG